ncbi:MAG TPA: AMP-binding protein, partial [Anaeromyxobacteraceae bacterium]|nr:AMP-binding protein [Anaeromyxobacteraceae bacterium]
MLGLMQNHPLLISSLIEHAAVAHPDREVVSWTLDGPPRRLTYVEVNRRAKRVAQALSAMGVTPGDRVATLAWNTHRHVELLFAVSGMGAVLHTVNPRLFPEQLEYIINHAADQVLLFDPDLLPLMEQLAPRLKTAKAFVALSDEERMPTSTKVPLLCYETLAAREDAGFRWPRLDENTASSLCYTSGTTGNPKGVLYSHRSTLLHTMALCMVDCVGLSGADTILLAAPMFHVNGWGKPYAAALCGARLVLPGPAPDSARLYGLMRDERATVAAAVPTVWLMLQQYIDAHGLDPASELELERVFVGGTAVPRAVIDMFRERFHADVLHAWGMTETSPVATVCRPLPK